MSRIEENVIRKIQKRAKSGLNKYNITTEMEIQDLTTREWIMHAQEEAMDLAIYLEKIQESMLEDYEELLLDMFGEAEDEINQSISEFPDSNWTTDQT